MRKTNGWVRHELVHKGEDPKRKTRKIGMRGTDEVQPPLAAACLHPA